VTDIAPARAALTLYTTPWCGPCTRLKQRLSDHGVVFDEVDVEQEPDAGAWIAAMNGGARTVPTVRFADGTALVNPPLEAVLARLDRSS
jgi:mycoredoxin